MVWKRLSSFILTAPEPPRSLLLSIQPWHPEGRQSQRLKSIRARPAGLRGAVSPAWGGGRCCSPRSVLLVGLARPIHIGRRVRPAPTRGLARAGEGWRGSGRPLCRQLAPARKGIIITKSRSVRRAAGRGLCGAPRGWRSARSPAVEHPGSRRVQAYVPDAFACGCMRLRACLRLCRQAWDADASASPHLQRLGTHPLSILASRLAFLPNAVLLTSIACSQRGPHLGTTRGAFPRPDLTLDSRSFLLGPGPQHC